MYSNGGIVKVTGCVYAMRHLIWIPLDCSFQNVVIVRYADSSAVRIQKPDRVNNYLKLIPPYCTIHPPVHDSAGPVKSV